ATSRQVPPPAVPGATSWGIALKLRQNPQLPLSRTACPLKALLSDRASNRGAGGSGLARGQRCPAEPPLRGCDAQQRGDRAGRGDPAAARSARAGSRTPAAAGVPTTLRECPAR